MRGDNEPPEADVDFLYGTIYFQFGQEIDAVDNGVLPVGSDVPAKYDVNTGISSRIDKRNPHWKSVGVDPYEAFLGAVCYIGTEFEYLVMRSAKSGLEELRITRAAFARRFELDPSGKIMEIPRFYQYLNFLKVVEGEKPQVVFLIYPREDQTWSIRAVGTGWSFELRKALPFAGLPARRYQRHLGSPVRFTRTSARSSRSLTRGSRSATKYLKVLV